MEPFFNQMINLRDRLTPIAKEYGNPNIQSLIIRKRFEGDNEYLEIHPSPLIKEQPLDREEIKNLGSIDGLVRAYSVLGISRRYKEEQLRGEGIDYLIRGRMKLGSPVGGIVCNLLSLEEKALTWNAVLIERISETNFYL